MRAPKVLAADLYLAQPLTMLTASRVTTTLHWRFAVHHRSTNATNLFLTDHNQRDRVGRQAQPRVGLRHNTTILSGTTRSANNFGHRASIAEYYQPLALLGNIGKLSVPQL